MFGIHIFRKDLRIDDNLALNELYKQVDQILPIFILDKEQIEETKNNKDYISFRSIKFMCESLIDLNKQLDNKLVLFYGSFDDVLNEIKTKFNPDIVSFNEDYTYYSLKRDKQIKQLFKTVTYHDQTLTDPNMLIKSNSKPYLIFGAFYKNHIKHKINNTFKLKKDKFIKTSIKSKYIISDLTKFYDKALNNEIIGGRSEALEILKNKTKNISNFKHRDHLATDSFYISAYLNFGCISIREIYKLYSNNSELIKQLIWRDFYVCLIASEIVDGVKNRYVDSRYNKIKWPKINIKEWNAFINFNTGFLLIDASMKQLINTGFISNRARLLLATFWIKYLLIDPFDTKYGAYYGFSKYLIDCATSQNLGNFLWIMGDLDLSGRRFSKRNSNPLTGRMIYINNQQIKKYDPDCKYIKKWLPHLKNKTSKELYNHETIFNDVERYNIYCNLFKNIK